MLLLLFILSQTTPTTTSHTRHRNHHRQREKQQLEQSSSLSYKAIWAHLVLQVPSRVHPVTRFLVFWALHQWLHSVARVRAPVSSQHSVPHSTSGTESRWCSTLSLAWLLIHPHHAPARFPHPVVQDDLQFFLLLHEVEQVNYSPWRRLITIPLSRLFWFCYGVTGKNALIHYTWLLRLHSGF